LHFRILFNRFAALIFPPILIEDCLAISWKTWLLFIHLKNQVMKKIRLITKNESVQAGLVIGGFVIIFAVLAFFFMGK
jgi:hypothetical protein